MPKAFRLFLEKIRWAMLFGAPAAACPQQVVWTHFTTSQGLPANVVYEVTQGRDGHLWFTTEEGICRFNGYAFVKPVDTSTWNGAEAFRPVEDQRGRIWFARIDGSLWYVDNDTIYPFKQRERLEPFRRQYQLPADVQIDADGSLWLAYNAMGLLRLRLDGNLEVFQAQERPLLLYAEINGRVLRSVVSHPHDAPPVRQMLLKAAVYRKGTIQPLKALPVRPFVQVSQRGFWKLHNKDILHAYDGTYYLLRADSVLWQTRVGFTAQNVVQTHNGALLMAVHMGKHPGLFYFPSLKHLQRNQGQNLLPGCFVTDIFVDRWGGWWATTHHAGVFYCKNPNAELFDRRQGLPSEEITCLAFDGQNRLYVGFRPAALAMIDLTNDLVTRLPLPRLASRDVEALLFDTLRRQLWCATPVYVLQGKHWHAGHDERKASFYHTKTLVLGTRSGRLWGASSTGFFEIDAQSGLGWHRSDTRESPPYTRTFNVVEDAEGDLWVVTPAGVFLWQQGRYMRPSWTHPALRFQPRQVCFSAKANMAIGLRNAGVLLRESDGRITHVRQANGLASDVTMRLYAGIDETFYACSNQGLSCLRPRPDSGWDVVALTRREGLPSEQVSAVAVTGKYLWVGTNRGLVRFQQLPKPIPMPSPILERLWINNRPVAFAQGKRLPYNANTLMLRFYSLHYCSEGNIHYRYRLLGADTAFTYSNVREVLFAKLRPGQYTFEVQAQTPNSHWSMPTRWHFRICPAWWQTTWFWLLFSLAGALGMGFAYRWQLRQKQQQATTREKFRELESAALRAQMNPHFIFNCLNSIQHFVADNNADAAAHYLACFARLVRLALHGAVDGYHSLREEIEMLNNYLLLEQLRFQRRFAYRISVDAAIDLDDTPLPPLLVQPFVENALLHGLQNKSEMGFIAVAFALKDRKLIITITDNGPGLKATNDPKHPHRSVGMMLTQQRLALLSDEKTQGAHWENLIHPDGTPAGLRVTLRIPL